MNRDTAATIAQKAASLDFKLAAVLAGLASVLHSQPGRGAGNYADQVQHAADRLLPDAELGEWHGATASEHRAELQRLLTSKRHGDA